MAEQMTEQRKRINYLPEIGFVGGVNVGDVVLGGIYSEIITIREDDSVKVLGRCCLNGVYSGRRELTEGILGMILDNEKIFHADSQDIFERACYDAGIKLLREAGL